MEETMLEQSVDRYVQNKRNLMERIDRFITFAQDSTIMKRILDSGFENINLDDITQQILEIKNKVMEDKVKISVLAEVSNGKSTFLNALIFRDKVLDARIGETTGRCYQITYGKEHSVFFNDRKVVFENLDELKKKIKELNDSAFKDMKEKLSVRIQEFTVVITLPHEMLKKGIEVIDTPGFGTMNEEHLYKMIKYAVETSDAVLILLDISQGVKKSEEEKFVQLLKTIRPDKRYIVFNKIDGYEDERDNFEKVKKQVIDSMNEILQKHGYSEDTMEESKQVFFISAKKALEAFRSGCETDEYLIIFKEMEKKLWEQLVELKENEFLSTKKDVFINIVSSKYDEVKSSYESIKSMIQNLKEESDRLEQNRETIKNIVYSLQKKARKILENLRKLRIVKSELLNTLTEKIVMAANIYQIVDEYFPNKNSMLKALEDSLNKISVEKILKETLDEKYGEIRKSIREDIKEYNQKVDESNKTLKELEITSFEFPKIEFSDSFLTQSLNLPSDLNQDDMIDFLLNSNLPLYAASLSAGVSWYSLGGIVGIIIGILVYILSNLFLSGLLEKKKEEVKVKLREEIYSELDNQSIFENITDVTNSNIMVVSTKVKEVEAISQLIIEKFTNKDLEKTLKQYESKLSNLEYVYKHFQEVIEYVKG